MTLSRLRHAPTVFALALLVRLVHLLHVAPTPLFELHRSFEESDMYMFDQWSRRIAEGDWMGRGIEHPLYRWQLALAPEEQWREWYGHPRAYYKAPFYPYLLAVLRRLFGDPMLPAALLQCLVSSLSAALLVRVGDRLFGAPAGLAGGLLFAVYAPAVHFDTVLLRGPWIVLIALLATLSLVDLAQSPTARRSFICGIWTACAILVNEGFVPTPLLCLALLPLWIRTPRALATVAGAYVCGLGLGLLPLVLRNLLVGAPPLGLAVTGSVVYAVFNAPGANPWAFDIRPQVLVPMMNEAGGSLLGMAVACLRGFPSLSSLFLFYLEKLSGLVIAFENPDNVNFYYAALLDPLLEVLPAYGLLFPLAIAGLAVVGRRAGSLAPALPCALALFASILLTTTLSRYRVTLAVFLFPPAGLALKAAFEAAARRDWRRLFGVVACVLLAATCASLVERRLERNARLASLRTRPQEFYLSTEAWVRGGRPDRAAAELLSLVRQNRDPRIQAWALVRAASLLAETGDGPRAEEALRLAARIGRLDAALLVAAGDARRTRLNDADGARGLYEEALRLAPPEEIQAQLQERLRPMEGDEGVK